LGLATLGAFLASERVEQLQTAGVMAASLIVPVFNSEGSLHQLFKNIVDSMKSSSVNFEIVFVDDGSSDGSVRILRDLQEHSTSVVIVEHGVNRGQSKAMLTGILAARYEIVVTLDDDLLYRPEDIPRLLGPLINSSPLTLVMGIAASMKRPLWRALAGICCNVISNQFLSKPLPLRLTTFCAFHKNLCAHLDPAADRDVALITELVHAADSILTIPVRLSWSMQNGSRYTFVALVRLFISRTSCYRLSRVLLWLACSTFLMIVSAALSVMNGALAYSLFGLASLMLGLLAIKVQRSTRVPDFRRAS
jgi:glycosyltransferase involved in cell wall biosynthesis